MNTTLIISTLIVILLIFIWVIYNQLITARESINEALAGIDVQLKKRFELIPRLVEIVKGYTNYEAETFEKVTALRSEDGKDMRSEEHTSELQSRPHLVCRLLLEKKKK